MFKLPIFYRQGNGPPGAGAPAATPTIPPASPTPSPPALDPLIYNPEGQSYKDLYNGTTGGIQSLKSQHVQALATAQGQTDAHLATIQERDAAITQLKTAAQQQANAVTTLTEQAQTIPDLVQRAGYADKLEIFIQYPQLVAAQTPKEVPGEEGADPVTVNVNPFLELIATTTLTGDPLRKHLEQLSKALPGPTQAAPTSITPVIPPQPTPATPGTRTSTLAELREELRLKPHDPALKAKFMDALALPNELGAT